MTAAVYYFRALPPDRVAAHRASLELRYSLRSLEVNAQLVDEVHVFGGRAAWFSEHVHHHPVRQAGAGKHANTWLNWRAIAAAAGAGELGAEFLLMNDDFFAVQPVAMVPAYHLGSVREFTLARRFSGAGAVAAVMETTGNALRQLGVPIDDQLAYEAHTPLPAGAASFAEVVPRLEGWFRAGGRVAKRTAYGNLAGLSLPIRLSGDVKVRSNADALPEGEPWWSTSEQSFAGGLVGSRLRQMFPRPSRYEIDI